MSEHPVAIFADQIRQGMRLEHPRDLFSDEDRARWGGAFIVTQVRQMSSHSFFDGSPMLTVTVLGVRDDGSPYHYTCGAHMVWLCHDAGPVKTL